MEKNEDGLSWREEAVYEYLCEANDDVVTHTIYRKVPMAKATALKSLAVLEAKNLISHEMLGPTKIWRVNRFCEKCNAKMKAHIIYECENCDGKRFIYD
jgi:hypothetical protein